MTILGAGVENYPQSDGPFLHVLSEGRGTTSRQMATGRGDHMKSCFKLYPPPDASNHFLCS